MAGGAAAQTYPQRPIRFVVPYPPGGASDVTARILAPKLQEILGQSVIIDNRGGANGIIGLQIVAQAPPDGHTLLMANAGPNAINPSIYKRLPYHPIKDFAAVSMTAIVPQIAMVHPTLPVKTVKELVAFAKANPEKLRYGSAGLGSSNHLSVELLKSMTGIQMTHVPYKGTGPGLIDALAGRIEVFFPTALSGMPHAKSGKLRTIGVTSSSRIQSLPDVPTIAESGIPGYEAVSWGGVMVPAGTPKQVVKKLHADLVGILAATDVKERLTALGAEVRSSTPDEFDKYIATEIAKWSKVAKFAKLSLDAELQ
jgi:tripartite-type tricarboxylate transporter receptor subunit TctC